VSAALRYLAGRMSLRECGAKEKSVRKEQWRKSYDKGLDAFRSGHPDDAAQFFEAAIKNGADRWEPFYAYAYVVARDLDDLNPNSIPKVESYLRRALELAGDACSDAAVLLATLRELRGDFRETTELLLRVAGLHLDAEATEKRMVTAFARYLDELEDASLDEADVSIAACAQLEALVEAASLPAPLRRALRAEVVATRAVCMSHSRSQEEVQAEFRVLSELVPGHPRIPKNLMGARNRLENPRQASQQVTFADIGGLEVPDTFQSRLRQKFEMYFGGGDPEAARREFREFGQSPTRSVLMFGPSGCGKTYLVRAFSGEYYHRFGRELPIQSVRLNDIMEKYVGESEKAISRLIDDVAQAQPCVLFMDEVDAVGMARDGGQDWRVSQTAHLLQELDRLQLQEVFVFIVGCTNRIWALDMALLRRFDELIPVELPDEAVRADIFRAQLKRLSAAVRPEVGDYRALARASHGLTPGDIAKAIKQASDQVLQERSRSGGVRTMGEEHLLTALREYQRPMHVREWRRRSVEALRRAGHNEMADEVERKYGPYVGELDVAPAGAAPRPTAIPIAAFDEEAMYDFQYLRGRR
jgi:AAA+ superfamily predicted ATPase